MKDEWKAYVKNQIKVESIRLKLLRARFDSSGDLKPNKAREYVNRHFPNLLKMFYDKGGYR